MYITALLLKYLSLMKCLLGNPTYLQTISVTPGSVVELKMPSSRYPHIRFARPIVHSISRFPTRVEYLYMNMLEHHVERCMACEPMLYGDIPFRCHRGSLLERPILYSFRVKRDGTICSTDGDFNCDVRVEISSDYWAVIGLLKQVYPYRRVRASRC